MPDDPFDLDRFVAAQELVYRAGAEELGRGRKASHWMWFVFPQVAGLGFSAMSQRYAISAARRSARLSRASGARAAAGANASSWCSPSRDAPRMRSSAAPTT